MSRTFVAIDVETASALAGSICEIGIASFQDGELTSARTLVIRPGTRFDARHIRFHGISQCDVQQAPMWTEAYPEIARTLQGKTIASHTMFERRQIFAACCRGKRAMFSYGQWIDTCATARRAWPELSAHSLPALAHHFGIAYVAHRAAEDARVAGLILLLSLETLQTRNSNRQLC